MSLDYMTQEELDEQQQKLQLWKYWNEDWNRFIRDCFGSRLDPDQQAIVTSYQFNRKTTVRSGHARGKDFVAANCSCAFLYLHDPAKVICTAPTGRQVTSIMMAEIGTIHRNAAKKLAPLGGEVMMDKVVFRDNDGKLIHDHFLEGFKAQDKATEAWTGYHCQNISVVMTEASGLPPETFDAVEGLLTGNSRLLIVGNPHHSSGKFYQSFQTKNYSKFTLNCMNAPNVRARKTIIPGQVDDVWVSERVEDRGWATEIDESEYDPLSNDFEWKGRFYRPGDLFLSRVMGLFPEQDEGALVPLRWVEESNALWKKLSKTDKEQRRHGLLRLGVDVAGMGFDLSIMLHRYNNYVDKIDRSANKNHMHHAGRTKNLLQSREGAKAFIDAIGEGAGVVSRLKEKRVQGAYAVKFSNHAKDTRNKPIMDETGQREFYNMRALCYWRVREALDPHRGDDRLMLPECDTLCEDLTMLMWEITSTGKIKMMPKDDLKKELGRSPDEGDALAQTYYPDNLHKVFVGTKRKVIS